MGRKKRRRGRDRAPDGAPGVAVETMDFALEEAPAAPVPSAPPVRAAAAAPTPTPTPTQTPAPPVDPVPAVQTLGEMLQQAREGRGLSIEETSARTRISGSMLQNLESDRFGEFAADAYVKGFLRNYGTFLGLDVAMLLRRYEAISGRVPAREPELLEVETTAQRHVRRETGRAWIVVVACAVVAVLCWVFWSRGATRLGLRPTPGLEQIETELQETTTMVPPPAPDPASVDDRADIVNKLPAEPPPPPPVAPVATSSAAATPHAGRKKSAKPHATTRSRPNPTDRGPIEDLVPPPSP